VHLALWVHFVHPEIFGFQVHFVYLVSRVHFVTPKIISFASRSATVSNLLRVLSLAGSATDFHSFVHGFEEPPSVGYLLVGVYRAAQAVQQETIWLPVFGISPAPVLNADDPKRLQLA
jgi:hypothetical protein